MSPDLGILPSIRSVVVSHFFSIRNFKNGTECALIGRNIQRTDNVMKNWPSNKRHQKGRRGSKCKQPWTDQVSTSLAY